LSEFRTRGIAPGAHVNYSAQLASRLGATFHAGTTAGALVWPGAFDFPGLAEAADGPPAIAATTAISAMIPDPRFPDFLFAISTSL
jgi:hypothetical protein